MKWFCEIVQDFDGTYYANMTDENGLVKGLPEYVNYKTLTAAIEQTTGRQILKHKDLHFKQSGRKKYAYINACCEGCANIEYTPQNLTRMKSAILGQ